MLDKLWFPNGVTLSPDESSLIFVETHALRVGRYHLKGEKKGQLEMLVEGLPGYPDNVTPDDDGFWFTLITQANPSNQWLPQNFANFPLARKFFVRFLALIRMLLDFISEKFPNPHTKLASFFIGSLSSVRLTVSRQGAMVRMDWDGKIVHSLHGSDGSVSMPSHVIEFKNFFYFASPCNNFLLRLNVTRAQ